MSEKKWYPSCELPLKTREGYSRKNRIYTFRGDYTWKGIKIKKYKTHGDDWADIARQVIIGSHGESTKFHLRYFEIMPGGYSSFETHRHEHVVICIRGRGKAIVGSRRVNVNFLDILYIKPDTPHRLYNPYAQPFGFFCIVDAERDRPRPIKKGRKRDGH